MMLWFIWRWVWVFNDSVGLYFNDSIGEIFSPNRLKSEKMVNINIFHEIFGVNCNREEEMVVIFASSFTSQVKNTKSYSPSEISELSLNKIDHFSIRYFYLHEHTWTHRAQWNCLRKATGQVLRGARLLSSKALRGWFSKAFCFTGNQWVSLLTPEAVSKADN